MDAIGHMNNVAYFQYRETVRTHYLKRVEVTHPNEQNGIGLLRAETRCRFFKPLSLRDQLSIQCGVVKTGNTSFHMHFKIHSKTAGLAAEADSVQVMYDDNEQQKTPIPDAVRKAIEKIQHAN